MSDAADALRRFGRIAAAGVLFQGGTAAVDSATIVATLVWGLTGSTFAVGAAAAIARFGCSSNVALWLGAQTAGALLSNPLWGWWGDACGKRSLLQVTAVVSALVPLLTLVWLAGDRGTSGLVWFAIVFALLGAAGNGATIAQLGYLMEISPDERRSAYSGYFNALIAPAVLLPLAGAAIAEFESPAAVFGMAALATVLQLYAVHRLRHFHSVTKP